MVGERYLRAHGVPAGAVAAAGEARTTKASMTAVAAWLRPRGLTRVLLVSDPFHMFRLRLEARRTALEAFTSPTESSPISDNPVLELRYLFAEGFKIPVAWLRSWLPLMTLVSSERLYSGRIVNLDLDTVRFPDGSTGRLEMLRHSGASAVVPFLDDARARRSAGPADPPVPPRGRWLHLGGPCRPARPGRIAGALRRARAGGGNRDARRAARAAHDDLHHARASPTRRSISSLAHDLAEGSARREADEFMELQPRRWSEVMEIDQARERSTTGRRWCPCCTWTLS